MIRLKRRGKNAVSPIISTVLLIMIVMILAAIILLWSRGFIKEAITKESGGSEKRIEQVCQEVRMTRILEGDSFGFTNSGNIPIYSVELITIETGTGSSTTRVISPDEGGLVNPGFATIFDESYSIYENVKVVPILLGKTKSGETTQFTCPEETALII